MANYREDILDIELENGNLHRNFMRHTIGSGDALANRFGVRVFRHGEPVQLAGNCTGYFIRSDGETIPITNGVIDGNVAYVTLIDTCYALEGIFSLAIKIASGGEKVTLRIVDGMVSRTSTDTAVDPGTIIPSVEDLIEAINDAVESVPPDYSNLIKEINIRSPHFPNVGYTCVCALTMTYSNNVYTITANHEFRAYGLDQFADQISIGHTLSSDFPMPNSFYSPSISGFAVLCFNKTDHSTSSWQIVDISTFKGNLNLCPIAIMYHEKAWIVSNELKCLFTNSLSSDDFLLYEKERIAGSAFWYTFLHNAAAPIAGRINFVPSEHIITFDNVILAPGVVPGSFTQALGSHAEVNWHNESNPNYARCIYFDNTTAQLVALCYGQSHPTAEESFEYRRAKQGLSLVCIVYNGNYVYTCGAALPGRWYKNGVDVYANEESIQPDLFKAFRKVGVIGDSLSVGYMYNKDTETATSRMLAYSWPKQVMKDAGVPWLNLGTSGQNVLTWCSNSTYGKVQAEAAGNKCQAYIIGLGENDQSDSVRGIPLGTASDIVDNYTQVATTYYGGYNRIIQILKHLNPDCKIFCLTNPRTGTGRSNYNAAVRYIATEHYDENDNVFLVDLANNESGEFNGSTFLPVDSSTIQGGHYSAAGYARIASIMEKEINKAMETNQTKMVNIAFIEYDTGDPTPNTMTE